jgi:hypothetical protein
MMPTMMPAVVPIPPGKHEGRFISDYLHQHFQRDPADVLLREFCTGLVGRVLERGTDRTSASPIPAGGTAAFAEGFTAEQVTYAHQLCDVSHEYVIGTDAYVAYDPRKFRVLDFDNALYGIRQGEQFTEAVLAVFTKAGRRRTG